MSSVEESTDNQVIIELNSDEQKVQGTEVQEEVGNEPQPIDPNSGDVAEDFGQAEKTEKRDKGDGEKKDEQEEKEELVYVTDGTDNAIAVEKKDEISSEEQQTPVEEGVKAEEQVMSVVISEPDKDVKTQEANAQTEGRESPVGKDAGEIADSTVKDENRVMESQSESESPLVAPPTSKAEKSIESETPAGFQTKFVSKAKDGFTANGK